MLFWVVDPANSRLDNANYLFTDWHLQFTVTCSCSIEYSYLNSENYKILYALFFGDQTCRKLINLAKDLEVIKSGSGNYQAVSLAVNYKV